MKHLSSYESTTFPFEIQNFYICLLPTVPFTKIQTMLNIYLDKEPQNISIGLGLLNELGTKMVSSSPGAKVTDVLRMQTNGLSTDLVELLSSQNYLGSIDCRRKDSKFGHGAHLKAG